MKRYIRLKYSWYLFIFIFLSSTIIEVLLNAPSQPDSVINQILGIILFMNMVWTVIWLVKKLFKKKEMDQPIKKETLHDAPVYRKKGKSLIKKINDYTVISIATTGIFPDTDRIIRICAVRVRNNQKETVFDTLINPEKLITQQVENDTGITDRMVKDKPTISEILPNFIEFIGDDVLLGHNVNFDINFLYDNSLFFLGMLLKNNYIDLVKIAQQSNEHFSDYRMTTLCKYYSVTTSNRDLFLKTISMHDLYQRMKPSIKNERVDDF